jgi:hypothetical protein
MFFKDKVEKLFVFFNVFDLEIVNKH